MRFKTQRIEDEWYSDQISEKLKSIMAILDQFTNMEFGKDIMLTDLMRTKAEQDEIYKDNPRYKERSWNSVHQYGRGADIRSRDFTQDQLNTIKNFLNCFKYDKNRPNKNTCTIHDVGSGMHVHTQVM
jgi:hypothetical protein